MPKYIDKTTVDEFVFLVFHLLCYSLILLMYFASFFCLLNISFVSSLCLKYEKTCPVLSVNNVTSTLFSWIFLTILIFLMFYWLF